MTDRTPHHDGLPDQGLRDYASRMSAEDLLGFCLGFSDSPSPNSDTYRQHLVNELAKAKAVLEGYDTGRALWRVVAAMGWDIYDVSDHVRYNKATYRDFIGTKTELFSAYPQMKENADE